MERLFLLCFIFICYLFVNMFPRMASVAARARFLIIPSEAGPVCGSVFLFGSLPFETVARGGALNGGLIRIDIDRTE